MRFDEHGVARRAAAAAGSAGGGEVDRVPRREAARVADGQGRRVPAEQRARAG